MLTLLEIKYIVSSQFLANKLEEIGGLFYQYISLMVNCVIFSYFSRGRVGITRSLSHSPLAYSPTYCSLTHPRTARSLTYPLLTHSPIHCSSLTHPLLARSLRSAQVTVRLNCEDAVLSSTLGELFRRTLARGGI